MKTRVEKQGPESWIVFANGQRLPEWEAVVGIIGLVAAMAYILFGHFTDRH